LFHKFYSTYVHNILLRSGYFVKPTKTLSNLRGPLLIYLLSMVWNKFIFATLTFPGSKPISSCNDATYLSVLLVMTFSCKRTIAVLILIDNVVFVAGWVQGPLTYNVIEKAKLWPVRRTKSVIKKTWNDISTSRRRRCCRCRRYRRWPPRRRTTSCRRTSGFRADSIWKKTGSIKFCKKFSHL